MPNTNLTLKDYLETATEASKRTRAITVVLIVASVLIFVGFLNSSDLGWIQQRLIQFSDEKSAYANRHFNKMNRDQLHTNLARSAVENAYVVRVPFFGVAFDVNDLSLLGGLGLIITLVLLRLSLRSQIMSLRIGFKAALSSNEEKDFYDLLAARQVFVFPALKDETQDSEFAKGKVEKNWKRLKEKVGLKSKAATQKRGWSANTGSVLRHFPKLISLIPFVVFSFIAAQDYSSREVGFQISILRTRILLGHNILFLFVLFILGVWCISKWNEIDRLWDYFRRRVEGELPPLELSMPATPPNNGMQRTRN